MSMVKGRQMRLSDYRIKTRIFFGFGSLIAIAAAVAAFGCFQLTGIESQLGKFVSVEGNTSRNLDVQRLTERMRRLARNYQVTQDETVVNEFDGTQARASELLAAAAKGTISEERRRLYGTASQSLSTLKESFGRLVELGKQVTAARGRLFTGGDELSAQTQKLVEAARGESEQVIKTQAADVENAVLLVRVANWRFLATHDAKGPITFKANVENAQSALSALEKTAAGTQSATLTGSVKTFLDQYAANFAVASSTLLQANELYENTMQRQFDKIGEDGAAAQKSLEADLASTQQHTEEIISNTIAMQLALATLGVLLGLGLAFAIGRSIAAPVSAMTETMPKLAAGEKSIEIPARDAKDEVGQMAQALEVFKQTPVEAERLDAEQRAEQQRKEGAFERHLKHEQGHQEHGVEIDHGQPDIGHLLTEREFNAPHRRHIEIGDRAKLLFAHDGDRHEDRRKQCQHQRHADRHHCVYALEVLIVLETYLDTGRRRRLARVVLTAGSLR